MASRLATIDSWEALAQRARFKPSVMAAYCGVSLRQLQRFFLATRGMSPGQWSRDVRIQQARHLISQGWSDKAVAAELGFTDSAHLCRDFKKIFSATPQAFALANSNTARIVYNSAKK
jgi:transcriptional regulator GlxA family with amidase domain